MNCKKCGAELPSEAVFCCFCGIKQIYTPRKEKQRGNGQGSVYQLPNGKWRAVITIGYDINGKRKTKSKQFNKKVDALNALHDLANAEVKVTPDITFEKAYSEMMEQHRETLTKQTANKYDYIISKFDKIKYMKMSDIRLEHLQQCVDESNCRYSVKVTMRSICGLVFEYCMKHDIIQKDYSAFIEVGKNDKKAYEPFTLDEIAKIKKAADEGIEYADYIMCLIFTGMRPTELFTLKKEDYYDGCLHGGTKTEAGKNRIIPVLPIIRPYIERLMKDKHSYLFHAKNGRFYSENFNYKYYDVLDYCEIEKKPPYSCRHTFATLMNMTDSNDLVARKKLMGHSSIDMTKHYTHADIEQLTKLTNSVNEMVCNAICNSESTQ